MYVTMMHNITAVTLGPAYNEFGYSEHTWL